MEIKKLETIIKIQKKLKKYFEEINEYQPEDIGLDKCRINITDKNYILGIVANTELGNRILLPFTSNVSDNRIDQTIEKFTNKSHKTESMHKSSYAIEYIKLVFDTVSILYKKEEKVTFKMGTNYPIIIETNDLTFVLAPRID